MTLTGAEGSFHLGCAVWSYPDWVGPFYPEGTKSGDMLALYGQRLRAVEGNTTFYATPAPETLEMKRAPTISSVYAGNENEVWLTLGYGSRIVRGLRAAEDAESKEERVQPPKVIVLQGRD